MYPFSYHVPIRAVTIIALSNCLVEGFVFRPSVRNSKFLTFVKKVFLILPYCIAFLCGAKDKEFYECQANNDSLKRDLYQKKKANLRSEHQSQEQYINRLSSQDDIMIIQDNHIEYHYYLQSNTQIQNNDSDPKLPFTRKAIQEWKNIKEVWEFLGGIVAVIFTLFGKRQLLRKWNREPVETTAKTIKHYSPPIYFRWFRRKVYKFYSFLV